MADETSEVIDQQTAASAGTSSGTGVGSTGGEVASDVNANILKKVAADLYSSSHIATDDIADRLDKLEAYLKKVDGE